MCITSKQRKERQSKRKINKRENRSVRFQGCISIYLFITLHSPVKSVREGRQPLITFNSPGVNNNRYILT